MSDDQKWELPWLCRTMMVIIIRTLLSHRSETGILTFGSGDVLRSSGSRYGMGICYEALSLPHVPLVLPY